MGAISDHHVASSTPSATSLEPKDNTTSHLEETIARQGDISPDDAAFLAGLTDDWKKKVVRKVDVRLVPLLALLYLFSFLDRANIGKFETQDA